MSNFNFLEDINKDLAKLGTTAEKLFRDEYYDQCITQTGKMAEAMTKSILGSKAQSDDTFEDMLYKLKTISKNNFQEQEFISDMYFLKKQRNIAVHSVNSQNDGKIALECLEHLFEASINYAFAKSGNKDINRLIFDEKLLVLGEKNNKLQSQYKQAIKETKEKQKESKKSSTPIKKSYKKDEHKKQTNNQTKEIINKIIYFTVIISLIFLAIMFLKNNIEDKSKKPIIQNKQEKVIIQKNNSEYSFSKNFTGL